MADSIGSQTAVTEVARIGLILIGDEILSGTRTDRHFDWTRSFLASRGLGLSWVHYAGDDRQTLTNFFRYSLAQADNLVISCGGIGATPDDHTRQALAAALALPLELHPEANQLISRRCAEQAALGKGSADMTLPENRQRLKMGEFPVGSAIVPNPCNGIPGFMIRNHVCLPGFPEMAWPMISWIFDHPYAHLAAAAGPVSHSIYVRDTPESRITPLLEQTEQTFPAVKVFCLPSLETATHASFLELGVKSRNSDELRAAFEFLRNALHHMPEVEVCSSAPLKNPHIR